jgi:hypothetical protein
MMLKLKYVMENHIQIQRREQKKKPRTEGGETEKRRRRRAFFNRCLHCYLRLRLWLHHVKSYFSLWFCVIVARKQCEGNLITFALWVTGLEPLTRLHRLGPVQPMLVGLDPAPPQKKEIGWIWALGPADPNYVY